VKLTRPYNYYSRIEKEPEPIKIERIKSDYTNQPTGADLIDRILGN